MKLVNWIKWGMIILFFLVVATPFSVYSYIKYNHYITEKKTYEYLIEYGYKDVEIISIDSKYKKLSLFTAEVTFEDESDITYDYTIKNKKVIQIGPTLSHEKYKPKHLENQSLFPF